MTQSQYDPVHPSDEQLAAFLDGRLTSDQRDRVLAHLAACAACRADMTAARVAIGKSRSTWSMWRRPALLLMAAVLAFVFVPRLFEAVPQAAERTPAPAASVDAMPGITVILPADRDVVTDSVVELRWRSGGADATYHVALQDGAGRLVWETTIGDTTATVPRTVTVERGETYFWLVDARLADGRTAASGANRFSVR